MLSNLSWSTTLYKSHTFHIYRCMVIFLGSSELFDMNLSISYVPCPYIHISYMLIWLGKYQRGYPHPGGLGYRPLYAI